MEYHGIRSYDSQEIVPISMNTRTMVLTQYNYDHWSLENYGIGPKITIELVIGPMGYHGTSPLGTIELIGPWQTGPEILRGLAPGPMANGTKIPLMRPEIPHRNIPGIPKPVRWATGIAEKLSHD